MKTKCKSCAGVKLNTHDTFWLSLIWLSNREGTRRPKGFSDNIQILFTLPHIITRTLGQLNINGYETYSSSTIMLLLRLQAPRFSLRMTSLSDFMETGAICHVNMKMCSFRARLTATVDFVLFFQYKNLLLLFIVVFTLKFIINGW